MSEDTNQQWMPPRDGNDTGQTAVDTPPRPEPETGQPAEEQYVPPILAATVAAAAASPKQPEPASDVALNLDTLEREGAKGPFIFTHAGRRWMMSDPQAVDWQKLLRALRDPVFFLHQVLPADDRDSFFDTEMPIWKLNALMSAYQQHYGLPEPGNASGSPD